MLKEKRVKHMVKLALHETKSGKEEFKASAFFKKDYITIHVLRSAIWMTIGYVLLTVLLLLSFLDVLLEDISMIEGTFLAIFVMGLYAGLLVTYILISRRCQ